MLGCWDAGMLECWDAGIKDINRPLPLVVQDAKVAKEETRGGETFFESRDRAAFKKVAVPDGM